MDRQRYRGAEEQLWSAYGSEPEETEVQLPRSGTRVRVQVVGTGPPVLLVHGAPSAGTAWAPLVPGLAGFRCDTMRHDGEIMAAAVRRGRFAEGLLLTGDLLAQVKAPTLFLWGGDDGFGGPDVGDRLVGLLPDAVLDVVEDGGHLPWLDDPAQAGATVGAWLRRDGAAS